MHPIEEKQKMGCIINFLKGVLCIPNAEKSKWDAFSVVFLTRN
jgi:hypothetical protein